MWFDANGLWGTMALPSVLTVAPVADCGLCGMTVWHRWYGFATPVWHCLVSCCILNVNLHCYFIGSGCLQCRLEQKLNVKVYLVTAAVWIAYDYPQLEAGVGTADSLLSSSAQTLTVQRMLNGHRIASIFIENPDAKICIFSPHWQPKSNPALKVCRKYWLDLKCHFQMHKM